MLQGCGTTLQLKMGTAAGGSRWCSTGHQQCKKCMQAVVDYVDPRRCVWMLDRRACGESSSMPCRALHSLQRRCTAHQQVQATPAIGPYSDPLPELSGVLPDERLLLSDSCEPDSCDRFGGEDGPASPSGKESSHGCTRLSCKGAWYPGSLLSKGSRLSVMDTCPTHLSQAAARRVSTGIRRCTELFARGASAGS